MIAVEIGKGCVLVLPERVYLAGLTLGKTLRRRVALLQRTQYGASGDDLPREAITLPAPQRSRPEAYQDAPPTADLGPSVTNPGPADTSSQES